jgi:hypothetical protein
MAGGFAFVLTAHHSATIIVLSWGRKSPTKRLGSKGATAMVRIGIVGVGFMGINS